MANEIYQDGGEVHDVDEITQEEFKERLNVISEILADTPINDRLGMIAMIAADALAAITPETRAAARKDMLALADEYTMKNVINACDA